MATTYQAPGVYVEEVDRGTKPIEGAGASTAAFIGVSDFASFEGLVVEDDRMTFGESIVGKPKLIANWTQYLRHFGGLSEDYYLPDAVFAHFNNGGGPCYVVSLRALQDSSATGQAKAASVSVRATRGSSFVATASVTGRSGNQLSVQVSTADEKITIKVGSESKTFTAGSKEELAALRFSTVTISKIESGTPKDGTYSLEGGRDAGMVPVQPLTVKDVLGDPDERTGLMGLESIDEIRLLACPDIMAGYENTDEAKERVLGIQLQLIAHCERLRYRFAILDTPPGLNIEQAKEWREKLTSDRGYAAIYYPWVKIPNINTGQGTKLVPPSGHIAGVYNRVDADRGVHKAPANEVMQGVIDVERRISKEEQNTLNPVGVNCIRGFPSRGIRVWGARTLSTDGSWRYINVRRLFIFVEASMEIGLQWVVFEPNDRILWGKVRRDVTAFLRNVWRSGALFGASPSEAFYVKCDEELNPPDVRDLGQLIIEVGMSPVKPVEFVIFRISQWAGPNAEVE